MLFRAFSYVSLVVTLVFKFSYTDQCEISIGVTHHDVYIWLSLWLKSLLISSESLYFLVPCVSDLFNVGLWIAENVSCHIRMFLHVALTLQDIPCHYLSLKEILISSRSAAY